MNSSFKFAFAASTTLLTFVLVSYASPLPDVAPISFQCPVRDYDFDSLQPGQPFLNAADSAWSIKVTPTDKDPTDCGAIFDTSFPTVTEPDLGTPGECVNGPGRGEGGRRGSPGENCYPLREVLLCHVGDMQLLRNCACNVESCAYCNPDDRSGGAVFNITFKKELTFNAFTMIDLENSPAMIIIHPDGKTISVDGYGENSVQRIKVDLEVKPGDNVILQCLESCALARLHVSICDEYNLLEPTTTSNAEPTEAPFAVMIDLQSSATGFTPTEAPFSVTIDLQSSETDFTHNSIAANINGNPLLFPTPRFAFSIPPHPTIFTSPEAILQARVMPSQVRDLMTETPAATWTPEPSNMAESQTGEPSYTPEHTVTEEMLPTSAPSILNELGNATSLVEDLEVVSSVPELLLPEFPPPLSEARDPIITPITSPLPSSIVIQIDMTPETTTAYICSQKFTPIAFNNFNLGSAVSGGLGFKMRTRRVGHDEHHDVSAVLDTSNPPDTDKDLGSPNSKCPGGGPGYGEGGIPGERGENCEPLGKIVIAHSGNVTELRAACSRCPTCNDCSPNDSNLGAEFIIIFTMPSLLRNVVMLDVDEAPSNLVITTPQGIRYEYTGLGDNSKLSVSLRDELANPGDELKIYCRGSCGLVSVGRTICIGKSTMTTSMNSMCRIVREDFEGRRTGFPIEKGPHWKLETCRFLALDYQCGVSAAFNTSDPLLSDTDLGSPNEMCPGGGPGAGVGGMPGTRGENCQPLNQVLIGVGGNVGKLREICARQNCRPNDHADGVVFRWVFNRRVAIRNITMLDLDVEEGAAKIFLSNGYRLPLSGLGDNSVQTVDLRQVPSIYSNLAAEQPLIITCSRSCAIASLSYEICD